MAEQRTVPCGIGIPQVFYDHPVDMELVRTFVTKAETQGFESLWVQERIVGGVASLEPINLLSYVAALTQNIRLGTSVLVASTRNPVMLAKEISTLDHLSNGRVIVGIGLGGRVEQYHLFGAPSEGRVRFFLDSLQVMKAFWTQNEARLMSDFWTLNGETMEPKPVQKPHPPLWIGGLHPNALRRAAKYGDGWMGNGNSSTEQFRQQAQIIRQALEAYNRDPSAFPIAKRVYIALDDNQARAEGRMTAYFGQHYGRPERATIVVVCGNASRCVDKLMEVIEAGAQMIMLDSAYDEVEQMEALAEQVVPHL